MFSYKLSENTELRLLEERHAQQLTDLTNRNREYLRAWLPWVDTNRTVEDRKNFIRGALKQFAQGQRSEGSPNGCTATVLQPGRYGSVRSGQRICSA